MTKISFQKSKIINFISYSNSKKIKQPILFQDQLIQGCLYHFNEYTILYYFIHFYV